MSHRPPPNTVIPQTRGRGWRWLIAAAAMSVLAACGGGGGGGGGGTSGGDVTIASIKITPGNVMLTGTGQSRQLTAQAFNVAGAPLAANFTWSSSKSDVGVDKDGRITSSSATGSAVITATVGGVTSVPIMVIVATPATGAVLVQDAQFVGSPELIDPTVALLDVGTRYKVTLTGVSAPALGSILLAAETAPVGGRVVAVQTINGQMVVTLEIVPLKEMFRELVINETIDLSKVQPIIPDAILSQYDVTREANGKMVFTPKTLVVGLAATPAKTFALGPFDCESTSTFPLVNAIKPSFTLTGSPKIIFQYDSKNGGLQRFTAQGDLEGEIKNSSTFDAAFEGSIECKAELTKYLIPIGGPLALVIGGQVPMGVGFKVGGKIIAAQVGFDMFAKASASLEMGIACPGGANCGGVTKFETKADADIKWRVPPALSDPLSQLKLEPAVFGFTYVDFDIGNPFLKKLRVTAFGAQGGAALGGSFATPAVQMLDDKYESKYQLTVDAVVEAKSHFQYLLKLLTINAFQLELKTSRILANSPTSTKVTADTETYKVGDTVTFTVELDPANLNFIPLVSNVDEVQILRSPSGTLIASIPGSQGKNIYTLSWIATESGTISGNFFAFVKTKLMPLPLIGLLELGPVKSDKILFFLQVNPLGTYYFVDTVGGLIQPNGPFVKDIKVAPTILNLTALYNDPKINLRPGDFLKLQSVGAVTYKLGLPETATSLVAVFRDANGNFLYPGAGGEFYSVSTLPTEVTRISTDILQDFSIPRDHAVNLQVPLEATDIAFAFHDSYFADNGDANGDFGVIITITIVRSN